MAQKSTAQLRGKLLIIDFWATWCGACLTGMVKLDSLQQQFASDMQVLLVSRDNADAALKAIKKLKAANGKPLSLPSLARDTLFNALLPHRSIPHYVWVNKQGKIIAVTGAEEATAQNIQAVLNNRTASMKQKRDVLDYRPELELLEDNNAGSKNEMLFRSTFTNRLEGFGMGVTRWEDSVHKRITYRNHSVLLLYQLALGLPANRLLPEVADMDRLLVPQQQDYFCYELRYPAALQEADIMDIKLNDLNRYLGLYGRVEKRLMPCFELVIADSMLLQPGNVSNETTGRIQITTATLARMLNSSLPRAIHHPIYINQTGIEYPLWIHPPGNAGAGKLEELNRLLRPQGLALRPASKSLDMFVISPKISSPIKILQ